MHVRLCAARLARAVFSIIKFFCMTLWCFYLSEKPDTPHRVALGIHPHNIYLCTRGKGTPKKLWDRECQVLLEVGARGNVRITCVSTLKACACRIPHSEQADKVQEDENKKKFIFLRVPDLVLLFD